MIRKMVHGREIPESAWEVGAYLIIGGALAVLEIAIYQVAYAGLGRGAVESKVEAGLLSTAVAYVLHKRVSFGHRQGRQVPHEIALFAFFNGLSVLIGVAIVAFARYALDQTGVIALQAANVVSIAVGVLLRFWGYRRWVFVR